MKRFYKRATHGLKGVGYEVLLDGRPVRTPAKATLLLPTEILAERIAAEWDAQGDVIIPAAMPLTRMATTAQDRMPALRDAAIAEVSGYAATDLLCHRADMPVELARRQDAHWQPHLDWLERHHHVRLNVTRSILPTSQPPEALAAIKTIVAKVPDWPLVGLHSATTALGSVVLGLALLAGALDSGVAIEASLLDEMFEIERWGQEREASRRQSHLRREVEAAESFLQSLRQIRQPKRSNGAA